MGNEEKRPKLKIGFFRRAVMAAIASATMLTSGSDALALANPYAGLENSPVTLCDWRFSDCEDLEGTPIVLNYWRFR